MVKMVSLKKSKADRAEEKDTLASPGVASIGHYRLDTTRG
jgi:hypothetical protein